MNGAMALIGVGLGFSLYQIADLRKEISRKNSLKKALESELSIIRGDLKKAHQNHNVLPYTCLPIITEVYDTSKSKLAEILKPNQLAIIQRTYAQIKELNIYSSKDNAVEHFRGYDKSMDSDDAIYFHDLNEEISLIDQTITEVCKK
jgi:hypothetical protein